MAIQHEVWRLVASGLFDTYIDSLVAVTSRDARHRLWEMGAFSMALMITAYESLSYVPSQASVAALDECIVDPVYNPAESADLPPRPVNAVGGSALVCDDPGEDYEVLVYSWDFTVFTEVGPLAENADPGPGYYVLANKRLADDAMGMPSLFLEITS